MVFFMFLGHFLRSRSWGVMVHACMVITVTFVIVIFLTVKVPLALK